MGLGSWWGHKEGLEVLPMAKTSLLKKEHPQGEVASLQQEKHWNDEVRGFQHRAFTCSSRRAWTDSFDCYIMLVSITHILRIIQSATLLPRLCWAWKLPSGLHLLFAWIQNLSYSHGLFFLILFGSWWKHHIFPIFFLVDYILISVQFSSVQSLSRVRLFATPWIAGLPVHHHLPEFTQTHVHRVRDAIQPSQPRLSPSPPALDPSQHQSLFQWVNSPHEVAKVLEFQL